eukprot:6043128-Pyramimonas_sp.AAC.1
MSVLHTHIHTHTVPNSAHSTRASGPRETKARLGSRGVRSTQNTVIPTAPPKEAVSATQGS